MHKLLGLTLHTSNFNTEKIMHFNYHYARSGLLENKTNLTSNQMQRISLFRPWGSSSSGRAWAAALADLHDGHFNELVEVNLLRVSAIYLQREAVTASRIQSWEYSVVIMCPPSIAQ